MQLNLAAAKFAHVSPRFTYDGMNRVDTYANAEGERSRQKFMNILHNDMTLGVLCERCDYCKL